MEENGVMHAHIEQPEWTPALIHPQMDIGEHNIFCLLCNSIASHPTAVLISVGDLRPNVAQCNTGGECAGEI